jgi:hypothetical protein
VTDAAPVDVPDGVPVVNHAEVLVPPVPGEEPLAREEFAQLRLQCGLKFFGPGEQLMVGEEDHPAIADCVSRPCSQAT